MDQPLQKRLHQSGLRQALFWSLFWIVAALFFNGCLWLYWYHHTEGVISIANQKAIEFFSGYLIEKILSIDNLFVFYMIFRELSIPALYQKRVLFWGVSSAIVLRLCLILLGIWLISRFHMLLPLMGILLCIAGGKALFFPQSARDAKQPSRMLVFVRHYIRFTPTLESEHFFIKKNRMIYGTPLLLALLLIEISDLVFAIDSIPAIFAITKDPVIIWTSNIFAILGLRALYFVLLESLAKLRFLQHGVALILIFIGCKMLLAPWFELSLSVSLGGIMSILISCLLLQRCIE